MTAWDKYQIYVYLAVAGLSSWLLAQITQPADVMVEIAHNTPDLSSRGYYKQQMGSDGLPRNELTAQQMQHMKDDGSSHFVGPVMSLFNPGQAPWVIKAEQAVMQQDGDHLDLLGDSVISRAATSGKKALNITTANVKVKLSTHFAQTAAWTEIVSPPHKTVGTGMELTFDSPIHLKLLSKVKGRYELD